MVALKLLRKSTTSVKKVRLSKLRLLRTVSSKVSVNGINDTMTPVPHQNNVVDEIQPSQTQALIQYQGSTYSVSREFISEAKKQFEEAGLNQYLQSGSGGAKAESNVTDIVNRTIKFIRYVHNINYGCEFDISENYIVNWLLFIMKTHSTDIETYVTYLKTTLNFKNSTISNWCEGQLHVSKWAMLHASDQIYCNDVTQREYEAFQDILKNLCKVYRRKSKKQLQLRSQEEEIANRRLPAEGVTELQAQVLTEMAWVDSLETVPLISHNVYVRFMQILFAGMYAFCPQGRIGGIMSLKFKHGQVLHQQGFLLATDFKTSESFIYQPILLCDVTARLLDVYLKVMRKIPAAARAATYNQSINRQDDPLWLTWKGEEDTNIGRHITAHSRNTMGLHITSTALRSLMECTAEDLHDDGLITPGVRSSVSNTNGHSAAMVKERYIKRSRVRDVQNNHEFSRVLREQHDIPEYVPPNGIRFQIRPAVKAQPIDWGQAHPQYHKRVGPRCRIKWSQDEYDFIEHFVTTNGGPTSDHIGARLKAHIYPGGAGHEDACDIFHANHVLSVDRLHHALRRLFGDRCPTNM